MDLLVVMEIASTAGVAVDGPGGTSHLPGSGPWY